MSETRRKIEKKQKKGNKKIDMEEIDKNLNQIYDMLVYPSLKNTLPIRFILWIYTSKLFIPYFIDLIKNRNKKKNEDDDELIAEQIEEENRRRNEEAETKRRRLVNDLNPKKTEKSSITAPVVLTKDNLNEEEKSSNNSENDINPNVWTDNDKATLIKAISRYPGGTNDRWVKISEFVGKSAKQCIDMEKKLRSNFKASSVLNKTVGTTVQENQFVSDDIMTKRDSDNDEDNKKSWSQEQQKLLENALKAVDKNAPDKWEQIAEMIPGKTKVFRGITK